MADIAARASVIRSPGEITFHPLTRADFPLLLRWLNAPHVRAWWRGPAVTPAAIEADYGPQVDGADPARVFVFHYGGVHGGVHGGTAAGLIQCYRHADHPDWDRAVGVPGAAGIDYFIGEERQCGRGLGTAVITAFTPLVFGFYPDTTVIVATPQRDNRASCRALEKAGFTLLHQRVLDSDDPSDSGVAAIYLLRRPDLRPALAGR